MSGEETLLIVLLLTAGFFVFWYVISKRKQDYEELKERVKHLEELTEEKGRKNDE